MIFEKKRIVAALLCVLMLGLTVCASFIHKPTSQSAEVTAEANADEGVASTGEEVSADAQASDEDLTSEEKQAASTPQEASAESTQIPTQEPAPTATTLPSPETSPEPTLSPSPSPTPELVVERFEEEKTMYVSSPVNVRMGPSTDYKLCGHLNTAAPVTVRGVADTGWYLIFYNEQECFVSNKYLLDTPPATPAPAAEPATAQAASPAQETPAQPAPAPTPAPTAAPARVVASTIFVGDSRFVQMHEAVGETGVTWICENAKGYNWFVENAIPRIDNLVGNGTKILINLGVNDTKHADNYINMVNGKAAEWTSKGATVYYASVNPCWENPYVTNDEVINFNAKLSANLVGVHWIDSYTFLTENGYRLVDGLHYSDDTSAVIYNYFITCIQ